MHYLKSCVFLFVCIFVVVVVVLSFKGVLTIFNDFDKHETPLSQIMSYNMYKMGHKLKLSTRTSLANYIATVYSRNSTAKLYHTRIWDLMSECTSAFFFNSKHIFPRTSTARTVHSYLVLWILKVG